MYYPGMERYYNENLSNRITVSLAVEMRYAISEVTSHHGIPATISTKDEISPDILVRPSLPPSPIRIMQYNDQIVIIQKTKGGSPNA